MSGTEPVKWYIKSLSDSNEKLHLFDPYQIAGISSNTPSINVFKVFFTPNGKHIVAAALVGGNLEPNHIYWGCLLNFKLTGNAESGYTVTGTTRQGSYSLSSVFFPREPDSTNCSFSFSSHNDIGGGNYHDYGSTYASSTLSIPSLRRLSYAFTGDFAVSVDGSGEPVIDFVGNSSCTIYKDFLGLITEYTENTRAVDISDPTIFHETTFRATYTYSVVDAVRGIISRTVYTEATYDGSPVPPIGDNPSTSTGPYGGYVGAIEPWGFNPSIYVPPNAGDFYGPEGWPVYNKGGFIVTDFTLASRAFSITNLTNSPTLTFRSATDDHTTFTPTSVTNLNAPAFNATSSFYPDIYPPYQFLGFKSLLNQPFRPIPSSQEDDVNSRSICMEIENASHYLNKPYTVRGASVDPIGAFFLFTDSHTFTETQVDWDTRQRVKATNSEVFQAIGPEGPIENGKTSIKVYKWSSDKNLIIENTGKKAQGTIPAGLNVKDFIVPDGYQ